MKFIVERTSDQFMVENSQSRYAPCQGAKWNTERRRWEMEINNLDMVMKLSKYKYKVVISCQSEIEMPLLLIDDMD